MNIKKLKIDPFMVCLILWYLATWSWAFFTDSLDLAGNDLQGKIIAFFVIVINVAISTLVIYKTFNFISNRYKFKTFWQIILLGLPLFALMDFLVAWLTAIIWIGPQGSLDNILPLSSPSLVMINTPFGFASRLVGFFGLASFFWLIIFLLINKKPKKLVVLVFVLLCVLSFMGWAVYKNPNGEVFKATIISETLDNRVNAIKPSGEKLVVFPEYGLDNINNDNLQDRLLTNSDTEKTHFLGSKQINVDQTVGHLNVLVYGNNVNKIVRQQEKYRLIPGGEDLAYIVRIMLRATNQKATLDYFSTSKMVIKGSKPLEPFFIDNNTVVGAGACSSIISPKDYQEHASNGATIFSNSASLTIFKGSRIFAWQQKSLARFMSVANSRYFLQSANAASAYALDNNGNQLTETKGISSAQVKVINNHQKTIYTILGEYILAIGFLIISVELIKKLIQNKKVRQKSKNRVRKKTKKML